MIGQNHLALSMHVHGQQTVVLKLTAKKCEVIRFKVIVIIH